MANDENRYQKAMRAGEKYIEREAWQKALSAYRVAIDEFPRRPGPYAGLGHACLGLKQLGRALECFKLAARYGRGEITHLEKVADIQERMGQLHDAARTYMASGELMLRARRLDEAVANWQRAIRLDMNLLGAHKRLAMVFQRQENTRDAVRAYLAIARILQMQGENKKALRMCEAALRLDPENEDVLMAVELIRKGESAYDQPEEEEPVVESPAVDELSAEELAEADRLTDTVRQLAAAFESDRQLQGEKSQSMSADPIATGHKLAQEQLAAELFRDEDEDEDADNPLSKLERDALIGQGMDFEGRGQKAEALQCYQKAVNGGLKLPAAYFVLGMLYLENGALDQAKQYLKMVANEPVYNKAVRAALKR